MGVRLLAMFGSKVRLAEQLLLQFLAEIISVAVSCCIAQPTLLHVFFKYSHTIKNDFQVRVPFHKNRLKKRRFVGIKILETQTPSLWAFVPYRLLT